MSDLDAVTGGLLGAAVGDALGLPYEKLRPARAARLLGPPDRHRFYFGRGMTSDDAEHSCLVLQSLIASGGDEGLFARDLAKRLRRWLLLLPAGLGRATLSAGLKLLAGWPPEKSGVFSAGNGPAMRSAVLGAAVDDLARLRALVRVSSRITHTHPKAEHGARAVALAARFARTHERPDPHAFLDHLRAELPEPEAAELLALVSGVAESVASGRSTRDYALERCGPRGVSGFVDHTVPVVLHAWLSHPRDYRAAVTETILCGGDADTTASIVGGIVGSGVGPSGIPAEWLDGLRDSPRTVAWMRELARAVVERPADRPAAPPELPVWKLLPRNLLFLAVVLFHGWRRLLPPY